METVVVNEAIREYLEYNGYHHTLSVFLSEVGHNKHAAFDKKLLLDELRLDVGDTQSLPCLYSLVSDIWSIMSPWLNSIRFTPIKIEFKF